MQFTDSLPDGEENVWWQIVTPVEEVRKQLDAVRQKGELYLDLAVIRDGKYQAIIRVVPDQELGIDQDDYSENIYRINRAEGFFLDLDGKMTDCFVALRVVLEISTAELSSGYVVMWPEDSDYDAIAS